MGRGMKKYINNWVIINKIDKHDYSNSQFLCKNINTKVTCVSATN